MRTVEASLKAAIHSLISDTATLDAQILLAHVLNISRASLYTHPERVLTASEQGKFDKLIHQRQEGVPIAYLTGEREFWSLSLSVSPATLIPRPETELLVQAVLDQVKKEDACVLDLGTGSGAIALALSTERPRWRITAVDRSIEALAIAQKNAQALSLKNITFQQSDWFSTIPSRCFDVIVSNPPYIAQGRPELLEGDVAYEPREALVSGEAGLDDLKKIIFKSKCYLVESGWLFLEHGHDQGAAVDALLEGAGFTQRVCLFDHNGHPRVTLGQINREKLC